MIHKRAPYLREAQAWCKQAEKKYFFHTQAKITDADQNENLESNIGENAAP
jgi:hypothetical protein